MAQGVHIVLNEGIVYTGGWKMGERSGWGHITRPGSNQTGDDDTTTVFTAFTYEGKPAAVYHPITARSTPRFWSAHRRARAFLECNPLDQSNTLCYYY